MSNVSRNGGGSCVHHGIIALVAASIVSGCAPSSTHVRDEGGAIFSTERFADSILARESEAGRSALRGGDFNRALTIFRIADTVQYRDNMTPGALAGEITASLISLGRNEEALSYLRSEGVRNRTLSEGYSVGPLINLGRIDEAERIADRLIGNYPHFSTSPWVFGRPVLTANGIHRGLGDLWRGIKLHRRNMSAVAEADRYIRLAPTLFTDCSSQSSSGVGNTDFDDCQIRASQRNLQILADNGLQRFAPATQATLNMYVASRNSTNALNESLRQTAEDNARSERESADQTAAVLGVIAGTALGIHAGLAARRAQQRSAYVAPPPPPPSPYTAQVTRGASQPYAPMTGGSPSSVPQARTGAVQPAPIPPTRQAIPAPSIRVPVVPVAPVVAQAPRFRHWLQSSGSSHNVHVANDGNATIRCTVTLYYSRLHYERSTAENHTDTISVSPGSTNYTNITGSVGAGGSFITPGRHTVNCR